MGGRSNDGRSDGQTVGVSRRGFVTTVGALLLGHRAPADPLTVRPSDRQSWGIQLYAVRDAMKADVEGTLAALAAAGYAEVELAGVYGLTPQAFRAALNRAGLLAPSGHVGLPSLTETIDQTIADANALGHRYLVLPWVGEEYRSAEGWRRLADLLNVAGEKCRTAGLMLGYHNHAFEFDPLSAPGPGARCGYDALLASTDRHLVMMELDLFWIRQGGGDALRYFRDWKGRFRAVHIKDMDADGAMVDVGQGVMDWSGLLRAAQHAGARHFFAEHDEAPDQLAFARRSAAYLRTLRL